MRYKFLPAAMPHGRLIATSILCLIIGFTIGVIATIYVSKSPMVASPDESDSTASEGDRSDRDAPANPNDLVAGMPGAGIYPFEDMAFFATFLLARGESSTAVDNGTICVGLVGMNQGEQLQEDGARDIAPDIPRFLLEWLRRVDPNVKSLRDCVDKWSWQNTVPKLSDERSRLIVLTWPQTVFPGYVATSSLELRPGDIHSYGRSYLLKHDIQRVLLVDTDSFRTY